MPGQDRLPPASGSLPGWMIDKLAGVVVGRLVGDIPEEEKAGVLTEHSAAMQLLNVHLEDVFNIMERFAGLDLEYGRPGKAKSIPEYTQLWNMAVRWNRAWKEFRDADEDGRAEIAAHPDRLGVSEEDVKEFADWVAEAEAEPGGEPEPEPDQGDAGGGDGAEGDGRGRPPVIDAEFRVQKPGT